MLRCKHCEACPECNLLADNAHVTFMWLLLLLVALLQARKDMMSVEVRGLVSERGVYADPRRLFNKRLWRAQGPLVV